MSPPPLGMLLYEHEDGRYLAALAGNSVVAGDPKWHRMGPIGFAPELAQELTALQRLALAAERGDVSPHSAADEIAHRLGHLVAMLFHSPSISPTATREPQ